MEEVMRVVNEETTIRTADEASSVGEPEDRDRHEHGRVDHLADSDDRTPEEEGYGYGV
jgi:hypothetical protein